MGPGLNCSPPTIALPSVVGVSPSGEDCAGATTVTPSPVALGNVPSADEEERIWPEEEEPPGPGSPPEVATWGGREIIASML